MGDDMQKRTDTIWTPANVVTLVRIVLMPVWLLIAEAARIDDRIASMWQGHPHWRHIPSRESFEEKAEFLLKEVLDFLNT